MTDSKVPANEHTLSDVLESIADPIVSFDKQWRYRFVSRRAAEILGKRPDEMIGQCIWDLFPEDRDSGFEEACHRAWRDGVPVTFERRSNLLGAWVETHIYPFENGAAIQWRKIGDRKQLEEARQRENALLHGIVTNIPVMLCLYDPKLATMELNREFERVLGWTTADANAGDFLAKVYPDPEYRAMAADYMQSLAPGWREFQLMARDGRMVPSEWANVRLSDQRIIGIGIDLRARRQAEESLRASEARYRALFSNSLDAVLLTVDDGRIEAANPAACRLFGMSEQEICRLGRSGIVPDDPRIDSAVEQRRLLGHARAEVTFVRGNGTRFEGEISSAVLDEGGRSFVIIRDITEQKKHQEALRQSEQRLRALVHAGSYVVYRMNRDWTEMSDLEGNGIIADAKDSNQNWLSNYIHRDDQPQVMKVIQEAVLAKRMFELEHRVRRADGTLSWTLSRAVPLLDAKGEITEWVGAASDVTERKRTEERLRLTQKLESVGLLAGGIAHDFNNLLTAVLGNASLLLDDVGPDHREMVRTIINSAERAAHLTRQLLAYAGKGQLVVRDLDISQTVNEMVDLMQFSIPKSAALSTNLERRLPPVTMDPGQFHQILMNLVINAGEAIGEGNRGRITVATSLADIETAFLDAVGEEIAPGRYVVVEVADTGSGIDPAKQANIFDPFVTTKFTGRGLGLAAVAGILRALKGGVTLQSLPGKGTVLRVVLPVAVGRPADAAISAPAEGHATVLIVDDETAVREFIASVLGRQAFQVLSASGGHEALAACDETNAPIDAAIVDVAIPGMGANGLLVALRAKRPGVKILLTSGYGESEARRQCAAYPDAAFIQKPYTAQQLASALEDLLKREQP